MLSMTLNAAASCVRQRSSVAPSQPAVLPEDERHPLNPTRFLREPGPYSFDASPL
jgi:hypothetical protein